MPTIIRATTANTGMTSFGFVVNVTRKSGCSIPISLDPSATTDIYLDSDEQRPREQRVPFRCRFLTCRQRSQVAQKVAEARDAAKDAEKCEALLREALAIGVVGPVKEGMPCTLDNVWAVLSPLEMWELADQYPDKVSLSELDRKKSERQSPSSSAASAVNVAKPAAA